MGRAQYPFEIVSEMTRGQRRGLFVRHQIPSLTLGQKFYRKEWFVRGNMEPFVLFGQKRGRAVNANRLQHGLATDSQVGCAALQLQRLAGGRAGAFRKDQQYRSLLQAFTTYR